MLESIKQSSAYKACGQVLQTVYQNKGKLISGAALLTFSAYAFSRRDATANMPTSLTVIPERILSDLGLSMGPLSERGQNLNDFRSALENGNLTEAAQVAQRENIVLDLSYWEIKEFRDKVYKLAEETSQPGLAMQIFKSQIGKSVGTDCEYYFHNYSYSSCEKLAKLAQLALDNADLDTALTLIPYRSINAFNQVRQGLFDLAIAQGKEAFEKVKNRLGENAFKDITFTSDQIEKLNSWGLKFEKSTQNLYLNLMDSALADGKTEVLGQLFKDESFKEFASKSFQEGTHHHNLVQTIEQNQTKLFGFLVRELKLDLDFFKNNEKYDYIRGLYFKSAFEIMIQHSKWGLLKEVPLEQLPADILHRVVRECRNDPGMTCTAFINHYIAMKGANVILEKDSSEKSPLIEAIISHSLGLVDFFISKFDVKMSDQLKNELAEASVQAVSSYQGQRNSKELAAFIEKLLKILEQNGFNEPYMVANSNGRTILHEAIARKQGPAAEIFKIKAPEVFDQKDKDGATPRMIYDNLSDRLKTAENQCFTLPESSKTVAEKQD